VDVIKASEVVQKALAEIAAAAAASNEKGGKAKAKKEEKPSGKKKGEELPVAPPKDPLPLEAAITSLARLATVLTRLVRLETAEEPLGQEDLLRASIISIAEALRLPLPWPLKRVLAGPASKALGMLASTPLDAEHRRRLVRDSQALGPLLDVVSAAGGREVQLLMLVVM
jgi:hypothetical protein